MKRLLLVAILLLATIWCYVPEKTYIFQSGALIKASELNKNEDDFFNALTDGLADLSILSLKANTVTATTYNYTGAVEATLVLSAADTRPATVTYTIGPDLATGPQGICTVTNSYVAIAPVHIPQGASLAFINPVADTQYTITLYSQAIGSSTQTTICSVAGLSGFTAITGTIDNTANVYYIKIGCANAGAARYYEYTNIVYHVSSFKGLQ